MYVSSDENFPNNGIETPISFGLMIVTNKDTFDGSGDNFDSLSSLIMFTYASQPKTQRWDKSDTLPEIFSHGKC
jgi:hypothetical protein